MSYLVREADAAGMRLHESDPVREILRNVAVILATPKGSVPLYRDFGVDQEFLDKPAPVAMAMLRAAVLDALDRWEKRVEVIGITFENSEPGRLKPIVEVEIIG